jgi:VCBS repeat-containing protein
LRTDTTSTVSYIDNSDTPAASTILTLQVDDGGNTGSGGARTATTTTTIAITAANDAPVAVNDTYSGVQGSTVNGTTVLANDTDVDSAHGSLTAVLVSGPGHAGTFHLNADGTFTYTPAAGFTGSDYFTYRTSDGNASSNIATVTINVTNSPLIAANDAYGATEDAPLVVAASGGVLSNDSDLDPAATLITATIVTNAGHGTVSVAADGSFTYTPDADFYGTDSFTYQASDNAGNPPVVATVTITVAPVNDAPVLSPHAPADVAYVENAAPTALFASEAVTDIDNPANFNGGSLTVAIASGFQAGDQIALLAASGFSVVAGHLPTAPSC